MAMKWRMAQMDLARQPETTETIRSFIDLLAKAGFHALLLYLEDRISTASYSSAANESYTPAEMAELVQYAQARKIELIPCVPVLGHAERFLARQELADCAELRGGIRGRFIRERLSAFCPSLEKTRSFLAAYLSEVAAIFPSTYFHIGMDEVWDLGFCHLCRKKSEGELLREHLLWVHKLLADLGKRCIIWADMLPVYPELLKTIPHDVLLADWHYNRDIHTPGKDSLNHSREDFLGHAQEAGFTIIAAVSDFSRSNIRTGYRYAKHREIEKMLITTWARPQSFFLRQQIMFFYGGAILQGKSDDEACAGMIEHFFGTTSLEFQQGLKLAMQVPENRFGENFSLGYNWIFCRPFKELPWAQWESYQVALHLLENHPPPIGLPFYRDILLAMRARVLSHRIKATCHYILQYGLSDEQEKILAKEIEHAHALMDTVIQEWPKQRGYFTSAHVLQYHQSLRKNLAGLLPILKENRFLLIRFCQPDSFGSVHTSIEWNGQAQHAGIYKSLDVAESFFEMFFPLKGAIPKEIKITCSGYGGQGIAFVEIRNNGVVHTAKEVEVISGKVSNPEHILCNDAKWAYFGLQSVLASFANQEIARAQHSIKIKF